MKKGYLGWINLMRSIAIGCAVMCHAVENIYNLNVDYLMKFDPLSRLFGLTMFSIGRYGVPMFLGLTGYLLLDRYYDKDASIHFWKTKWLRMLICTEVWIVLYNIFLRYCMGYPIIVSDVIRQMFFLKNIGMSHMWYMPMILGMYIFIPFVGNVLKKFDFSILTFPLGVVFLYTAIVPILNVFFQIIGREQVRSTIALDFSGGLYGLYIIAGYAIKKGILKNVKAKYIALVGGIFFGLIIGLELYAYQNQVSYNVWYNSGFLMISSICIFELMSRMDRIPCECFFKTIARYSFPIFLVHNPILMLLKLEIVQLSIITPLKVIILWICTMIISFIVSIVISKIPKIGTSILYMR